MNYATQPPTKLNIIHKIKLSLFTISTTYINVISSQPGAACGVAPNRCVSLSSDESGMTETIDDTLC